MKIRHIFTAVLLLVLQVSVLFPTATAAAQGENEVTGYSEVTLWLSPENDRSDLLVIFNGRIEGAELPATVSFLIPSTAELYLSGSRNEEGFFTAGDTVREPSEIPGWDKLSYEMTEAIFWLEYYDPIITGYPDKTIAYEFRWLYPISSMEAVIEEPYTATGFNVSPAETGTQTSEGITFHVYKDLTPAFDEQPMPFDISYTKEDMRPSQAILQEAAAQQQDTEGEGGGMPPALLTIIVVVAIGALGVGAYFLVTRSRRMTRAERRQAARAKRSRGASASDSGPFIDSSADRDSRPKARFCRECGKPLDPDDVFCASCGTKVG